MELLIAHHARVRQTAGRGRRPELRRPLWDNSLFSPCRTRWNLTYYYGRSRCRTPRPRTAPGRSCMAGHSASAPRRRPRVTQAPCASSRARPRRPTSSSARWPSSARAAYGASPTTRRCLTSPSRRRRICSPTACSRCTGSRAASPRP